VSSPGMEKSRLTDTPANVARWYTDNVPTLRYAETEHRGFMVLTVTPQSCQSTWYFVDTVSARQYAFFEGETWAAHAGERRLVRA
ncbi:MAG TPA: alkaline phosphatase, partial [Aquabacterium sp.]|nr:alkaline phosphatase [Aquabacterium sp.]